MSFPDSDKYDDPESVPDSWESIYEQDQVQVYNKVYNNKVYNNKVQITSIDLFCLIFSFLDINKSEYLVHRLFKNKKNKDSIFNYWKRQTHYTCLYEKDTYVDIVYKTYYRNGKKHSEDDLPAYEVDEFMTRRIKMWYANGRLHRVGKPASIECVEVDTDDEDAHERHSYYESGTWKCTYTYYKNGRVDFLSPGGKLYR